LNDGKHLAREIAKTTSDEDFPPNLDHWHCTAGTKGRIISTKVTKFTPRLRLCVRIGRAFYHVGLSTSDDVEQKVGFRFCRLMLWVKIIECEDRPT